MVNPYQALSQNITSIEDRLSKAEQRQLEKGRLHLQEGDRIATKAQKKWNELQSLKSSSELTEKKSLQKKASKLEQKYVKESLKAAEYYKKAYQFIYEVYTKNASDFQKEFTGSQTELLKGQMQEEEARELKRKAESERNKASQSSGMEAVNLHSGALELENKALEKQRGALEYYLNGPGSLMVESGPPVEEYIPESITDQKDTTKIYELIVIDKDQVNRFKKFIEENEPDINYDMTLYDFLRRTDYSIDSLRDSYYTYVYGPQYIRQLDIMPEEELLMVEEFDSITRDKPLADAGLPAKNKSEKSGFKEQAESPEAENKQVPEKKNAREDIHVTEQKPASEPKTPEAKPKAPEKIKPAGKETIINKPAETGENIVFRVQIAAGRKPLSQGILMRIYNGNKSIELITEEGWHKYSIGNFASYEEANQFRQKSDIPDAFIVAYRNNSELNLYEAYKKTTPEPEKAYISSNISKKPGATSKDEVVYRVQIAANRQPISKKNLGKLYNGNREVTEHFEDNWYRYSIASVGSYQTAKEIKNEPGVPGDAFIAPYRNGKRIGFSAVKQNNSGKNAAIIKSSDAGIITPEGMIYFVQIAASKVPVTGSLIKNIYTGSQPVYEFHENGWYKYRLVGGNSYNEATRLSKQTGVKGAFVVSYYNGKRINIKEAIKTKN